jgi:hypothetical protein
MEIYGMREAAEKFQANYNDKYWALKIDSLEEATLFLEALRSFEEMNVTNAPNINTLKDSIKEIELAMRTHKLNPHKKGTTAKNGNYLSPTACSNCDED